MWLDDGDCITFNMGYPICKVDGKSKTRFAYWINNGIDINAHSSFSLIEKNPFVLEMVYATKITMIRTASMIGAIVVK